MQAEEMMKFVIQRVKEANVVAEGTMLGQIEKGLLVLVGISHTDTVEIADKMVKKMLNLRIFEDENDKTNLSLQDVGGSLLIISQFTLYADCRKGNRPSFVNAGSPEHANALYEHILAQCQSDCTNPVEHGKFGAKMQVSLVNDGPFTVILDSDEIITSK